MKRNEIRMKIGSVLLGIAFAVSVLVLGGCQSLSPDVTTNDADANSLRVGVFMGKGARSIGAFQWLALTTMTRGVKAVPIDGPAVRAGVLDNIDVVVMPGGRSVQEAASLEKEGREKLKAFIRRGGGYVGTCAGCCLLMQETKGHPNMLGVVPFTFGENGGGSHADLLIRFNKRANELAGIPAKTQRIRFSEGPVPVPTKPVEGANIEVVGNFASDINSESMAPKAPLSGHIAALAGTYGEGRIFVTAVHPEMDVADHSIIKGMFRYVTGRELEWAFPQRRRGQLVVGVVCDDSFGVETATFLQRLLREREFDLVPISAKTIAEGALRHVDAILAPNGMKSALLCAGLYERNLNRTKEFVARGGCVIAWGSAAEAAKKYAPNHVSVVADPNAALLSLREFASETVAKPTAFPGSVEKPVRAAFYTDKGGSNIPVGEILKLAPEYDLSFLSAAEIGSGALTNFDLLVQPGGGCNTQYQTLGTNGTAAIERFVRGGGKYYGICAGAFLGSQTTSTNRPRIGLAPYKADTPEHYRGWGPIRVKLTPEGLDLFPGSTTNRTMIYWGGPAFLDGDPVPDSDMKVFGRYNGVLINTCSEKPVMPLAPKAAFVGGRLGKGKVFLSATHPEKSECNYDLVRGILKYLTGVRPSKVNIDRSRGAISVFFQSCQRKEVAQFYMDKLLTDRRFDLSYGKEMDDNLLPHTDVVVLSSPSKTDLTKGLRDFLSNGGRVVILADTKEKEDLANTLEGTTIVRSLDEIIPAILK
ncbi:MAG: hypothetical protein IKR48_12170 [Kiritimatiellae bacterium]|nr:hypothetical protein [Kiritimatiellia bacterium]